MTLSPWSLAALTAEALAAEPTVALPLATEPPPAVVSPEAAALVERMRAALGNPGAVDGLSFTFVVGSTRREHQWDVAGGRVAVRYRLAGGTTCTTVAPVGYDGPAEGQRDAWAMFVNDQFWLLAPWKVADPGATVTLAEGKVVVRYDGVGLTPGDTYRYEVGADGVVAGWSYTLGNGREGSWAWAPPTEVGPLRLSLERTSGTRTIRFEDVRVGPVSLGPDGTACRG